MKKLFVLFITAVSAFAVFFACGGSRADMYVANPVPDGEMDPAVWGKAFPLQYESWKKTGDPKESGTSTYRRGWDKDKVFYDKLSEMPYIALLYKGWGFGIDYNEPRGHAFAIQDITEADPSRPKPGAVCLACKSPMHKQFAEKNGLKYLTSTLQEGIAMMPENMKNVGPACVDCHNAKEQALTTNKEHIESGLKMLGKTELTRQEQRSIVCAQCHCTYYIPRTGNKKVNGNVVLPWQGSKWGDISVENIIKVILSGNDKIEWNQAVTGFDLPYSRHPEFEMFSKSSPHFNAGLSCADCHMPYMRSGSVKISSHDMTSPLKQGMKACAQCHTESAEWLRDQVAAVQDRTLSIQTRAGYSCAEAAKLFELVHKTRDGGKSVDADLYSRAKESYIQGLLRFNFASAENSMGFHNPMEAARILSDAASFAGKSSALLRQILTQAGVKVPAEIDLELNKYLNSRGKYKKMFKKEQEFKDPFKTQEKFYPASVKR